MHIYMAGERPTGYHTQCVGLVQDTAVNEDCFNNKHVFIITQFYV